MTTIIARGSKDDGSVNLYARLYKRPTLNKTVALGISVSETDWHYIESTLKGAEQAQRMGATIVLRDELAKKLWEVKTVLDGMIIAEKVTPESVRASVNGIIKREVIQETERQLEQVEESTQAKYRQKGLVNWVMEFIRQCESGERLKQKSTKMVAPGTIKNWKATMRQLEGYEKYSHKVLGFDDMTLDFYDDWKHYFIKKKYSPNTIARHVKSLKTFLFAAKDMKLTTVTEFESKRFSADFVEVDNIYLTEERVQEMYAFNPTDIVQLKERLDCFTGQELSDLLESTEQACSRKALELSKDVFVIGCLTGQRVSDYIRINEDMIRVLRDGKEYINLQQKKTGKDMYLPLDGRVRKILAKYGGRLPKVYDQKVNKHIKIVGHLLGWTEPAGIMEHHGMMEVKSNKKFYECIKTHTARRTFATIAYQRGVSLASIMAVTGHSTEQMLRKYLKLDNKERAILAAEEFERLAVSTV